LSSQCEEFDGYEAQALNRSTVKHYKTSASRKKKRTIQYDENRTDDTELNGHDNFRINTIGVRTGGACQTPARPESF